MYVTVTCICCKGKWRTRVAMPKTKRHRYLHPWRFDVICGRCNSVECSRPEATTPGVFNGCHEGRRDAA